MAATDPNFDADAFIEGIHTAMSIGFPPDVANQPTFHFAPVITNALPADAQGVPFDVAGTPVKTSPAAKRVPCAVEYVDGQGKVVEFGIMQPSRIVLTFLGEDYEQVRGFDWVVIGANRYFYTNTRPPLGLDVVPLWQVECKAEDEQ